MIRKPISVKVGTSALVFTLFVLLFLYSWLSYQQKQFNPTDTTVPNGSQFIDGVKIALTPNARGEIPLWEDLKATYWRHLLGMLLGIILSLSVGLMMGCWPIVESALRFPIACLGKVPPTAMIAVYFILFGTDLEMFVAMIGLGIFPNLAQAVFLSVKADVSDDTVYKAYTLGASDWELIFNVVLPQILPRFIDAIRMATGPAMVFLIAAEWMMSDIGIGYRLRIQSRLLNMNVVYVYLIVLCLTMYVIDWSLKLAKKKVCPWSE